MSVRAWFTISAAVLLLLGGAFVLRLFSPIQPPAILARASDEELDGVYVRSCWHQRRGNLSCQAADGAGLPASDTTVIDRRGKMRIVAAYPVQPKEGTLEIETEKGKTVIEAPWLRELNYSLEPGIYVLTAEAKYGRGAYVRYVFRLRVA